VRAASSTRSEERTQPRVSAAAAPAARATQRACRPQREVVYLLLVVFLVQRDVRILGIGRVKRRPPAAAKQARRVRVLVVLVVVVLHVELCQRSLDRAVRACEKARHSAQPPQPRTAHRRAATLPLRRTARPPRAPHLLLPHPPARRLRARRPRRRPQRRRRRRRHPPPPPRPPRPARRAHAPAQRRAPLLRTRTAPVRSTVDARSHCTRRAPDGWASSGTALATPRGSHASEEIMATRGRLKSR
jgi:hypothetical protein